MRDKYIILTILLVSLTQGFFYFVIGISISQSKVFIEFLSVLLFIIQFRNNKKFVGISWIFLIILISIFSGLTNDKSNIEILLFLRKFIFPIIFFWAISNSKSVAKHNDKITKFLIILLTVQIPITIIKFILLGITEQVVIGSMDPTAGSLPAILPMAIVGASFSKFLYKEISLSNFTVVLLSCCFFGLVGGKRASFMFIIIIMIIILIIYSIREKKIRKLIKYIPAILTISIVIFYFSVRLFPSFNPENKVFGRFDYNYFSNYINDYSNRSTDNAEGSGRMGAWLYSLEFLETKNSVFNGTGAGDLVYSSLTGNLYQGENFKYNLGYGFRIAALQLLIQIGILGLITYILLFYSLIKPLFVQYYRIKNHKFCSTYLAYIAIFISFLWDIFTYSPVSLECSALIFPFMYIVGVAHNRYLIKQIQYQS